MRLGLRWTARARRDLIDIGHYVARDHPARARAFVLALWTAMEPVRTSPGIGRVVPEIGDPAVRELIRGNYRIVYHVARDRVTVLTVFEGHRRLDASAAIDAFRGCGGSAQRQGPDTSKRRR